MKLLQSAFGLLVAMVALSACQEGDETSQASPTTTDDATPTVGPTETADSAENSQHLTGTFAGSGETGVDAGGHVDGARDDSMFRHPAGLAIGPDGAIYVADSVNGYVRRIAEGEVATVAGTGDPEVSIGAQLPDEPAFASAVGVSPDGTVYIADSITHRIFSLDVDGTVSPIAGGGAPGIGGGGFVDGSGSEARFSNPVGIAVLADGGLVVADKDNHAIRTISPDGAVETLAGGPSPGLQDGEYSEARFAAPVDVAVGADGTIYVLDQANNAIRALRDGTVTTVVGGGAPCDVPPECPSDDLSRIFTYPSGFDLGDDGAFYVADSGAQRVLRIGLTSPHEVTALAGSTSSERGLRDGPDALFDYPADVLYDPERGVFVSDSNNHRIRLIHR